MQLVMFGLRQDCALPTRDSLRRKHGGCFALRNSSWKLKQVQCSCETAGSGFPPMVPDQPEPCWAGGVCQGVQPPGKALGTSSSRFLLVSLDKDLSACGILQRILVGADAWSRGNFLDRSNLQTNPSAAPGRTPYRVRSVSVKLHLHPGTSQLCETELYVCVVRFLR